MNAGTPKPVRPRIVIELEALPAPTPAVIRLRRLLKTLLRSYQFRAVSVPKCDPGELERVEIVVMTTSPALNKFRRALAVGDWIQWDAGEPLRIETILGPDRVEAVDRAGQRRTLDDVWNYRRIARPAHS